MRAKSCLGIAAIVAFALASSCGGPSARVVPFGLAPEYVTVPAAMGPLIPADAVVLLYLESIDEAERSLNAVTSDPGDSSRIDLVARITDRFGIPGESIDRTRPAALALSLFNIGRLIPVPIFILPVHDETQVIATLQGRSGLPQPLGNKGYVGVPLLPGYEMGSGIPALAKDLPAGSVAARLRVDRIMDVVRPLVDAALRKAEMDAMKGDDEEKSKRKAMEARKASAVAQQLMEFLEGAETAEAGLRTQGGTVAVGYRLRVKPDNDSFVATMKATEGLVELAGSLSEDYPVMGLVAADFERLIDVHMQLHEAAMEEALTEMTPPVGESIQALVNHTLDLYRLADDQLFYAMRFTDAGLEMIHVLSTRNPDAFMEESRQFMSSDLMGSAGLGTVDWDEPAEFEGVRIETARVHWDLAKIIELQRASLENESGNPESVDGMQSILRAIMGSDSMVIRLAAVGNRILVVTSPPRAAIESCITNFKKHGRLPAGLRAARAYGRQPLCFWTQSDVRDILLPILRAAHVDSADGGNGEMVRRLEAMEPVRWTAYATAGQQAYEGACNLNLAPLRELVKALKAKHEDDTEAPEAP